MALRIEDLTRVNGELVEIARALEQIAKTTKDRETAEQVSEQVNKLAWSSRRMSVAIQSVANVTIALLETS